MHYVSNRIRIIAVDTVGYPNKYCILHSVCNTHTPISNINNGREGTVSINVKFDDFGKELY